MIEEVATPEPATPPPHPRAGAVQPAIDSAVGAALARARARLLRRARIERTGRIVSVVTGAAIGLATIRALQPAFDLRAAAIPAFMRGLAA